VPNRLDQEADVVLVDNGDEHRDRRGVSVRLPSVGRVELSLDPRQRWAMSTIADRAVATTLAMTVIRTERVPT
jgi:hypothetical protein